jgi:hypothetical protein
MHFQNELDGLAAAPTVNFANLQYELVLLRHSRTQRDCKQSK